MTQLALVNISYYSLPSLEMTLVSTSHLHVCMPILFVPEFRMKLIDGSRILKDTTLYYDNSS
jgi:hypothetical protein